MGCELRGYGLRGARFALRGIKKDFFRLPTRNTQHDAAKT